MKHDKPVRLVSYPHARIVDRESTVPGLVFDGRTHWMDRDEMRLLGRALIKTANKGDKQDAGE